MNIERNMHPPPLASSIIEVIGRTPMVELHRIVKLHGLQGRLLAKLDYLNPGFSKKDRIAREMILEARRNLQLRPGQTVVELTSGNTGTGLAIVCKALGHPLVVVMSRGNTMERARMMKALGAEVILVDQAPHSPPNQVSGADLALVEQRAQELVKERGAFRADQFRLSSNVLAHGRHTGPEIWEQSQGKVDVFVDFAGSGGTFTGTARFIAGARLLAAEEGIFGGFSSGAHLAAALGLLWERERGATVAFLICDSGLKYLSTDLFPCDAP